MKSKRIKLLISVLSGFLLLSVIAFIVILNLPTNSVKADSNNKSSSNQSMTENKRHPDLSYVSLAQLESYFNVIRTYDEFNNPVITVNKKNVTFNQNDHKIHYKKRTFKDKFAVEDGEVYIPTSFIASYFDDVHIYETKVGPKLTHFKHIPILLYHTVNHSENNTINTDPKQFEDHIKTLVLEGYTGITPQELYDFYYGVGTLPNKPVFINFDDGYKDNFTEAYPILKKYNMKATIFVIASRIEHEGTNSYPTEIPKLTWEDAITMKDLITIQNHTWDSHRKIKNEKDKDIGQIAAPQKKPDGTFETKAEYIARITNDLTLAQNIIKEKLDYESLILSYPYGEYSNEVLEVAPQLGIKFAVSVSKGKSMHLDSLYFTNRMVVDGKYSGKQLIKHIKKEYH